MSQITGGSKKIRVGSHPNGRAPTYQNKIAFTHNPKSKKSAQIMAVPVTGLCRRCTEKIEWRKQYRKYKPLTAPASCRDCKQKTVTSAYHKMCKACASKANVCAKCCLPEEVVREEVDLAAKQRAIEVKLGTFRLRTQRSIARKVAKGEMKLEDVLQMEGDKPGEGEDDDDDDDDDDDVGDDGNSAAGAIKDGADGADDDDDDDDSDARDDAEGGAK